MKTFSALFLLLVALSCHSQTAGYVLDPADFQKKIKETPNAVVLDVRTPEELKEGFIKGAINIDYNGPNFKTEIAKLDTNATYFVYCRSGRRSSNAATYMRSIGFSKVYELNGGIVAWQEKGLPVSTGKD